VSEYKYPLCQASRDFLKGGDRALYDFLCRHYSVEISAIVIQSTRDYQYSENNKIMAGRYVDIDEIINTKLKLKLAGEKVDLTDIYGNEKVQLIIPTALRQNLIHEREYIDHTGNESQDEQMTYMATAVIISNKK